MSLFFPDNDVRQARLSELATDLGGFLQDSKNEYKCFTTVIAQLNVQVAALYRDAGLTPPGEGDLDIAGMANISLPAGAAVVIKVSEGILDITAFAITSRYVAPGLVSRLMASGLISEEAAAATFVTAWGGEFSLGIMFASLATVLVAGVIITGIGLAFNLFEGASLRDELRHGISKACQVRADVYLNLLRSQKLVLGMQAVRFSMEGFAQQGLLTQALIRQFIESSVLPVIAEVEGITIQNAISNLASRDSSRKSWTNEDSIPVGPPPSPSKSGATFAVRLGPPRPPSVPQGCILCPSIPGVWDVPTDHYPSIKKDKLTIWPFSFADHRNAINVVVFDSTGALVNQWQLNDISTVTKIHADPDTNMVCFTGDKGAIVHMLWSQLDIAPPPSQIMQGRIGDVLEISPASIDFGLVGASSQRPLMLCNRSNKVLSASAGNFSSGR